MIFGICGAKKGQLVHQQLIPNAAKMRHCGSIQTHPRKINVEPIKGMFGRCLEYTLEDERLEHVIIEVGKIIFLSKWVI